MTFNEWWDTQGAQLNAAGGPKALMRAAWDAALHNDELRKRLPEAHRNPGGMSDLELDTATCEHGKTKRHWYRHPQEGSTWCPGPRNPFEEDDGGLCGPHAFASSVKSHE